MHPDVSGATQHAGERQPSAVGGDPRLHDLSTGNRHDVEPPAASFVPRELHVSGSRRSPDEPAVRRHTGEGNTLTLFHSYVRRDGDDLASESAGLEVERLRQQVVLPDPEQMSRSPSAWWSRQAARQRRDQANECGSIERAEVDAAVLRPSVPDEEQEAPATGQSDGPVVGVLAAARVERRHRLAGAATLWNAVHHAAATWREQDVAGVGPRAAAPVGDVGDCLGPSRRQS